jgi:N-acetylmuramoyl-L-alanine amidase
MNSLAALGVLLVAGVGDTPAAAPSAVLVATSRGQLSVPVSVEQGHPSLPVPSLSRLLPIAAEVGPDWAVVAFAGHRFRFLLGAPALIDGGRVVPLVGGAYLLRDTLFVPLEWLTDHVPRAFREGYRYDPLAARFEEAGLAPVVRSTSPPPPANASGLRERHTIVVDAGHGGNDAGNPGLFLPRGVNEKHITLAIANRLKGELEGRGIAVIMTRSSDTLVGLYDRAPFCSDDCDLFVSIHVDALNASRGYQQVNGPHTYFIGDALTAEARRVAALENEAIRYETGAPFQLNDPRLFILKDLQTNEFLRESALLADLVQSRAAAVHPGRDRGVAQSRLAVLASALRPAILIETGFATNRSDAMYLNSRAGQERLAKSIADGIVEYLRRYEAKTRSRGR